MGQNSFKAFYYSRLRLNESIFVDGAQQIQLLKAGTFRHPKAPGGQFTITPEILRQIAVNYEANVRNYENGELPCDYGHDVDGKSSGWIVGVELREDDTELWCGVRWTEAARESIEKEEYRYVSADLSFGFEDNETGVNYGPTLFGLGLVNRPHIRGMRAVFSEDSEIINQFEGVKMPTPEEMLKKVAELEARIGQLESMLKGAESKLEDSEKAKMEMGDKLEEKEKAMMELSEKIETLEKEKENTAKEVKFSELLNEGKVVPAQKDDFMKLDIELAESFFKNAVVNLSENGHGKDDVATKKTETTEEIDAADKVIKLAEERAKKDGIALSKAISLVLHENPELSEEHDKNSFAAAGSLTLNEQE